MGKICVGEKMTRYPFIADLDMRLSEAFRLMHDAHIRHLPVVNGERVVGLITDRSIRMAFNFSGDGELRVGDVMVKSPYTVVKGTPLSEVASTMASHKYGCVIIEDESERAVGIFTTTDGMQLLSELLQQEDNTQKHRPIEDYAFPIHLAAV